MPVLTSLGAHTQADRLCQPVPTIEEGGGLGWGHPAGRYVVYAVGVLVDASYRHWRTDGASSLSVPPYLGISRNLPLPPTRLSAVLPGGL